MTNLGSTGERRRRPDHGAIRRKDTRRGKNNNADPHQGARRVVLHVDPRVGGSLAPARLPTCFAKLRSASRHRLLPPGGMINYASPTLDPGRSTCASTPTPPGSGRRLRFLPTVSSDGLRSQGAPLTTALAWPMPWTQQNAAGDPPSTSRCVYRLLASALLSYDPATVCRHHRHPEDVYPARVATSTPPPLLPTGRASWLYAMGTPSTSHGPNSDSAPTAILQLLLRQHRRRRGASMLCAASPTCRAPRIQGLSNDACRLLKCGRWIGRRPEDLFEAA